MNRLGNILSALIMSAGILVVMATERTIFPALLLAYSGAFIVYYLVVSDPENESAVTFWIPVAILLRMLTLVFFPNLSDDIYRFIWDGGLTANGLNPYLYTPSTVLAGEGSQVIHAPELFSLLNSPDYYTIYPPFCQFLFWLGAALFKGHWFAQAAFLKGSILLAEMGSIAFIFQILKKLNKPARWVLIYALNPLVIVELTGNAHFEGWMIFFLLASYYAYLVNRPFAGGFFLGLGILAKLIPAIFFPFLIKRLGWRGILLSCAGTLGIISIAILPFIQDSIAETTGSSLGLYFQKFEFNASLYYVLRWIIGIAAGFNPIAYLGPSLAILFAAIVIWFSASEKKPGWHQLPALVVLLLSLYFFLSTTVHPWYICTIVAFASLTNIRFPILWSYLIFSTYISYTTPIYNENMWIVLIEYAALAGFILFEYHSGKTEISYFVQKSN